MQIMMTVIIHGYMTIFMGVQMTSQHHVFSLAWTGSAGLIASSVYMYVLYGYALFLKGMQELVLVIKVCARSVKDYLAVGVMFSYVRVQVFDLVDHAWYGFAFFTELFGIAEFRIIIVMTCWKPMSVILAVA
jgi:hypothetical protein